MNAPTAIIDRIRRHLASLKMPAAIERLDSLVQRFEQGQINPYELIETLLAEELHLRENRRIRMALQTARLATLKTLESFDFSFQPSIDRNRILWMLSCSYRGEREAEQTALS